MDEATAKKLLLIARKTANRYGYGALADDFSQFVILSQLEGKKKEIYFHLIDFLREKYGRTGPRAAPHERIKSKALHNSVEIKEQHLSAEPLQNQSKVIVEKLISRTVRNPFDSAVLRLSIFWDFSGLEIAEVFGVSRYVTDRSLQRSLDSIRRFFEMQGKQF